MQVCIVGGGKIGFYLAQTLLEHGHKPVVVEYDSTLCERLADGLDIPVIHGDGTKPEVLQSADLFHCSALVAVTGRDENNLIACQLAKQVFEVKKTVARVNNPRNAAVLKALGVDIAVSSTDNIAHLIEREVETAAIRQLLSLAGGDASITQINIPEGFVHHKKTLAQIKMPPDAVVISVTRGNDLIIPRGNTEICAGDKVLVLAENAAFSALAKAWHLSEEG